MIRTRLFRGVAVAGIATAALAASLGLPAANAAPLTVPTTSPAALPKLPTAPVVRIGFFANVTHAPALIAVQLRLFETFLGKDGTAVEYTVFGNGPAEIEAMKGGAIDVGYIGPNPAITGYTSTGGTLLRIVSGAAQGGAQFITKQNINSAADLKGKKIATPQLGGTQDIALRSYLKDNGLTYTSTGGGDVAIIPTENSTTLSLFRRGDLDGAWVPEPWASRLVLEGGGKVFIDEKNLWPEGKYVTTQIIASQKFLAQYPGTVRSILQANNSAIKYIAANVDKAKDVVQVQIKRWTGTQLADPVINRAWGNLRFSWEPLPEQFKKSADDAVNAGLLTLGANKLAGIYDLRLLNQVLKAGKARPVTAGGLGRD